MKTTRLLAALWLLASLVLGTGVALGAEGDIVHTVQRGDNLLILTKIYGVTGNRIRAANPNWADPNIMRPGDKIVIPVTRSTTPSASTPFFYTVAAGEDSLAIALKFEVDHQALARANNSRFYPFNVAAGQVILVPAGPHIHIVRAGETLSGVAAAFCTTTDVLTQANLLSGPGVFTGQVLNIPIHYNARPCPRGPVSPPSPPATGAGSGGGAVTGATGGPLMLRGVFIESAARDPNNPPNGATAVTRVEFRGGAAPFTIFNDGIQVASGLTPVLRGEGDAAYSVLLFSQPGSCPVVLNHTLRLVSADGQVVEKAYFLGPASC